MTARPTDGSGSTRRLPPDRRVRPTRAQTRIRLIDAAVAVIADRGYAGASVELISEQAGFSRGAFYSNFASKDELMLACYDHYYGDVRARLAQAFEAAAADGRDVPTDIVALVEHALVAIRGTADHRTWRLVEAEFGLHAARDADARAHWQRLTATFHAELGELIDAAMRRTGRRLHVDGAELAEFVHAAYSGAGMLDLLGAGSVADRMERRFLPITVQALLD